MDDLNTYLYIRGYILEKVGANTYNYYLVLKVKIADIVCNLLDNPSEHQKIKYGKAMRQLLASI